MQTVLLKFSKTHATMLKYYNLPKSFFWLLKARLYLFVVEVYLETSPINRSYETKRLKKTIKLVGTPSGQQLSCKL